MIYSGLLPKTVHCVSASSPVHNDRHRLIYTSDLIVRGIVTDGSRLEGGELWTSLRVERILKGIWPDEQIRFAADSQTGARYRRGEQAIFFLDHRSSGDARHGLFSRQREFAKYSIGDTCSDAFDDLISTLMRAEAQPMQARLDLLRSGLSSLVESSEPTVRKIAELALRRLNLPELP